MRAIYAVMIALALFAAGSGGMYALLTAGESKSEGAALIGGPFSLIDVNGKRVTERDFRGKLMLVFFGYAHCPDVCPTGLQTLSNVMEKLAGDAGKVVPVFISVDPKRDTPQVLAGYMQNFSPAIVALTGDEKDIASAAKAYRVYYRKAQAGGDEDYTVDHSAFVYLMDREGKYVTHFAFNMPLDSMLAVIRKKIAADNASDRS